jgi:hypothetical protein
LKNQIDSQKIWSIEKKGVSLHQQKKEIHRKGQIYKRAKHRLILSIVLDR